MRDRLLTGLGALSLAVYWLIAVHLEHTGGARDVWQFLGLFGGLFAAYFLAIGLTSGRQAQGPSAGRVSFQIIVWAALFRLALLPAGLPPESWTEDLAADLRSERIAYRSFLLYDNDVWRYFWDGHVFAAGLSPYTHAPIELEALADAVMPWYLLWVLPLAALLAGTSGAGAWRPGVLAWIALTALSLLSYLIYIDQFEHLWWLWVEYLGFFSVLAWGVSQRLTRSSRRGQLRMCSNISTDTTRSNC